MAGRKIVFIIPGFGHRPTNKAYTEIAEILKKEGYRPIPIAIPWKQTTISENTEYFLKEYKKRLLRQNKTTARKKVYILGFSFGAMIAFLAATKIRVSGLILCSLSPYFKEDVVNVKNNWISTIKKQRYQDFSKLRYKALAKKVKANQILMLYGAKETKPLIKRVTAMFRQISSPHKYLIPILKTEHNIGDRRYLYKIHQIAKELR